MKVVAHEYITRIVFSDLRRAPVKIQLRISAAVRDTGMDASFQGAR